MKALVAASILSFAVSATAGSTNYSTGYQIAHIGVVQHNGVVPIKFVDPFPHTCGNPNTRWARIRVEKMDPATGEMVPDLYGLLVFTMALSSHVDYNKGISHEVTVDDDGCVGTSPAITRIQRR